MGWSHFSIGFWANMTPTTRLEMHTCTWNNPLRETKQIHCIPIGLNKFSKNSNMNFKTKPYSENGAR